MWREFGVIDGRSGSRQEDGLEGGNEEDGEGEEEEVG